MPNFLEYYSRKEVQKAIVSAAKNKEVAVKYLDEGFGKRPDVLQFNNDVLELAKSGVTSFHLSEEHWSNPLLLKPGMTKNQLDDLRIGWDCILDIDCKFLEFSKEAALLLAEALKFHDIKNFGIKFSGNSGFHLGIPFESFPEKVHNQDIKLLFPDGVRVIASYLKNLISAPLSEKILKISKIEEIAKVLSKNKSELLIKNKFNPFSVLEIDSVLISSRHMYRAPYSINEKKGLVSIPLTLSQLKNFELKQAKIENVEVDLEFLPLIKKQEASSLIIQAFDSIKKEEKIYHLSKSYDTPKIKIKEEFFPPCIIHGLNGLEDGKKRFLFILLNFLKKSGYDYEQIEQIIENWNKKNKQPLKQGYINSQLSWHKRQKDTILPPNCGNNSYYLDTEICKKDNWCKLITNPVNYSSRKLRILTQNTKKKK